MGCNVFTLYTRIRWPLNVIKQIHVKPRRAMIHRQPKVSMWLLVDLFNATGDLKIFVWENYKLYAASGSDQAAYYSWQLESFDFTGNASRYTRDRRPVVHIYTISILGSLFRCWTRSESAQRLPFIRLTWNEELSYLGSNLNLTCAKFIANKSEYN